MDKKLLIGGSTIAVVVLVLASFSPVVGFNSVESSAKNSPLFYVRTNRAIDQNSNALCCEYIGQGKTFLVPKRNNKIEQMHLIIKGLQEMDDKTFEKFIASLINHVQKDKRFNDVNPDEIREALIQVRDIDTSKLIYDTKKENKHNFQLWTYDTYWCHTCSPGCWFIEIWWFLFWAVVNSIQALLLWFKNIRNAISAILPGCCETWN